MSRRSQNTLGQPSFGYGGVFRGVTWLVIAIFLAIFTVGVVYLLEPQLPINFFLVQSGSMEPSIMTGDIIVTSAERVYTERDVITFTDDSGRVTTHRIVSVAGSGQGQNFVTKGDANPDLDTAQVSKNDVFGRVILTIPRIGFLVSFGRSWFGVLVLLGIPALLIIVDEMRKIRGEAG